MTIQVGDRIPDVPLDPRHARRARSRSSSGDYFAGKRVALFAVPGRLHADLLGPAPAVLCRKGRRAEGQGHRRDRLHLGQRRLRHGRLEPGRQGREDITMLADGNGDFAEALGLTMDGSQVRHGQAQPALFDDRQRRRRRAAQCRGAGRIFGLERRDDARPALDRRFARTSGGQRRLPPRVGLVRVDRGSE